MDTAKISDERKKTNQFLGSNLQVANLVGLRIAYTEVVILSISLTRLGVCWSSRPNQHFRAKEFTEPSRNYHKNGRAVRIENSIANCEDIPPHAVVELP